MKRPLVGMAAALVLGEVIANAGNSISVVVWIFVSICFVIVCITRKQDYKMMIGMPACMGIGILLALQASKVQALDICLEQDTLECVVTGTVYWKEQWGEKWKIYIEKSNVSILSNKLQQDEKLNELDVTIEKDIESVVFSCRKLLLYIETSEQIPIGSVIQANGDITSFSVATNPGQFDAKQYYRAKNIDYPVYISSKLIILKEPSSYVREWLITVRHSLLESLGKICTEEEFGIFQAVFLGEKSSINDEIKSLYQANGISHILAISGLHISFLGNLLYNFLRKITGSYKWSMLGGIIVLLAYGWMTGFAISALRAVIMFICMMGAQTVGRTYDMLSAAGLSALLVLLEYPLQIYEAGFLLTYGAIIGIAGVMPYLEEILQPKKKMSQALLCSFSVQVVTLPVMLWFYYIYPIYSILLNLFVIPFAGYLLFSAMAGSIVGIWWHIGGKFLIGSGHYVLQYYNMLCHFVEKIPLATEVVGRPTFWQICIYYGVVGSCLVGGMYHRSSIKECCHNNKHKNDVKEEAQQLEKSWSRRYLFLIVVFSFILYQFLHPISNKLLHITMLDVDQGDCIFIRMPNGESMLIDGGSTGVKQVGTYRIVPYLLLQGVDTLERIVVTHPDADHMNGIYELLEDGRIIVKELCIPNMQDEGEHFIQLLTLAKEKDIQVIYTKTGDTWDSLWTCVHPLDGYTDNDTNSYSIMLRLDYGSFSALFTGDAGIEQERLLEIEPVTLLKVGHHGSKYSSGEEFISRIHPWISIISCGKNNSYGHPHEEVVRRLEEIGSQIVITSEVGAIMITTNGVRYWVETFLGQN